MIDLNNIASSELYVISEEEAWEREEQIAIDAQEYRERKEKERRERESDQ